MTCRCGITQRQTGEAIRKDQFKTIIEHNGYGRITRMCGYCGGWKSTVVDGYLPGKEIWLTA